MASSTASHLSLPSLPRFSLSVPGREEKATTNGLHRPLPVTRTGRQVVHYRVRWQRGDDQHRPPAHTDSGAPVQVAQPPRHGRLPAHLQSKSTLSQLCDPIDPQRPLGSPPSTPRPLHRTLTKVMPSLGGGIAGGDPVSLVSSQQSLIVFDQSYFFHFRISRIKHHKLSLALRDRSSPCFMVSLINNIECINIPSVFPTILSIIMGWN